MEKHTTKDRKKDTRSRKYQLTWNNPQDRGETHDKLKEIIYVFLTIFLYLLKCPQSLIL